MRRRSSFNPSWSKTCGFWNARSMSHTLFWSDTSWPITLQEIWWGVGPFLLFWQVVAFWTSYYFILKTSLRDFLGSAVVKNLHASTGDMGSIPGLRRFHMPWSNQACEPQQTTPHAPSTVAYTPRAHAPQQEKPPQWRPHTTREQPPLDTTGESPRTAMKSQHGQK